MSSTIQMRPLRVAAFTSGAEVPGARFRVRQYIPHLARQDIAVTEYWPQLGAYPPRQKWLRPVWLSGTLIERLPQILDARAANLTWLYREMVSTLVTLEGFTPRPRLLDVDDSVHLFRGGRTSQRIARLVDGVLVANAYLAEVWGQWAPVVGILPMAVDTDIYTPAPLPEKPVIGWLGSPANVPYLERIAPALGEVLKRFTEATLSVCSERKPDLGGVPFVHVPWTAAGEPAFIASLTIGLAPLADTPWERGKFSYKFLQYMASARPTVASPVGTNADILSRAPVGLAANTEAEWVEALSGLLADQRGAREMGAAARALAISEYSVTVLVPRLAAIMRGLL